MTDDSSSAKPPAKWRPVAAIAIVSALLAYLGLRDVGQQSILENSIHSSGHYFFFAMVAVLIAWSIPLLLPNSRRTRYRFVLAFVISVLVGALLEFAQSFLPYRSASWPDMVMDIYGAMSGAAAAAIVSHWLARRRLAKSRAKVTSRVWHQRWVAPVLLIVSSVLGLKSLGSCIYDHWQRDRDLPILLSSTKRWSRRFFWKDDGVPLGRVNAEAPWSEAGDQRLWEITLPDNLDYPGFGVYEPSPNWLNYESLVIDIENLEDRSVEMVVRIHDKIHDGHYTDRFHETFTVKPGLQTLRLPLSRAKQPLESGRVLDLSQVEGVKWFLIRPTQAMRLRIGNLRLE